MVQFIYAADWDDLPEMLTASERAQAIADAGAAEVSEAGYAGAVIQRFASPPHCRRIAFCADYADFVGGIDYEITPASLAGRRIVSRGCVASMDWRRWRRTNWADLSVGRYLRLQSGLDERGRSATRQLAKETQRRLQANEEAGAS